MSKNIAVLDNNNKVLNIIVVADDVIENDKYISYTNNNPAYIGGDYVDGFFYALQPYPSWTRNNGSWQAPAPMPTIEGKRYYWLEDDLSWREV